jgi:pullulanase
MSGRMSLLLDSHAVQIRAARGWLVVVAAVAFVVAFAVTLVSTPRNPAPRVAQADEPAGRVVGRPARLRSVARLPTVLHVPPAPAPVAPFAATLVVAPTPEVTPTPEATAVPTVPPPVAPAPAPPTTTTEPGPSFDSSDSFDSSG